MPRRITWSSDRGKDSPPVQSSINTRKNTRLFLLAWAVVLFAAILLPVFLHEDGHGVGARIDGVHVSTGFNRVGDADRKPGDADFRTNSMDGFWGGLLGPVTTWGLAIAFTAWLYRFKKPGSGALAVGALAMANGLGRGMPMLLFLLTGLGGQLRMEDEVSWGIRYLGKVVRRDLRLQGVSSMLQTEPTLLLSFPAIWIPTMFSLAVSSIFLLLAYRQVFRLWGGALDHWTARALFGFLPFGAWYAALPF